MYSIYYNSDYFTWEAWEGYVIAGKIKIECKDEAASSLLSTTLEVIVHCRGNCILHRMEL